MTSSRRHRSTKHLTRVIVSVFIGGGLTWLSAVVTFIIPSAPMSWNKSIAPNSTGDLVWQYFHDRSYLRDTVVSLVASDTSLVKRESPPSWSTAASDPNRSDAMHYGIFAQIASGFPFRSILSDHHGTQIVDAQSRVGMTVWKSTWAIPLRKSFDPQLVPPDSLPFKLIPVGFALSTVCWTVPVYIGFSIAEKLRASRRRRQRLCTHCTYPVPNLATCPECGTPVNQPSA
jgi:hypothetical protein